VYLLAGNDIKSISCSLLLARHCGVSGVGVGGVGVGVGVVGLGLLVRLGVGDCSANKVFGVVDACAFALVGMVAKAAVPRNTNSATGAANLIN
jgi:hypothetical protein